MRGILACPPCRWRPARPAWRDVAARIGPMTQANDLANRLTWDGLILGASLATLDADSGYGEIADGALAWRDGVAHLRGAARGPARRTRDAGARGDRGRRAGSRPAWSIATPTWCSPATARASSSCACRARATRTSPAPAAASSRPCARRAPPTRTNCCGNRCRARARCSPTARPRSRSSPATASTSTTSARCCASRAGSATRSASRCAPPTSPRTRCRRSSPAAPTTTSTRSVEWLPRLHAEGLVDAVDAFCEGIGFSPAQTRRVFEAARALGLPVKLHADQLSDLGGAALVAEFGGLSADHVEHTSRRRRARDGRARHGRGAAAGRVPRAARNQAAAAGRVPRTRRGDGGRDRLQPRHVAAAVAAAGDAAGLHAFQADAGGSVARRDRARRARARAGRSRRACGSARAPTSCAGRSAIRPSCATGSAARWPATCSPAASAWPAPGTEPLRSRRTLLPSRHAREIACAH